MSEGGDVIFEQNEETIRRRDDELLRYDPGNAAERPGYDEGPDGPCDSFVPDEQGTLTLSRKPACGRCGWAEDSHPLWGPEEGRW